MQLNSAANLASGRDSRRPSRRV